MACLTAVMQHTLEHWVFRAFSSREPTQCTKPRALSSELSMRASWPSRNQCSRSALVITLS